MRPLTDTTPKPLLPAGGKPLIVWHLERLARAGIRDIVVNHAWLGERIEAVLGDGSAWGVSIRYSAEGEALETAGGIARALPLLTESRVDAAPFLVISADIWSDADYGRATTIALQMQFTGARCWCVMVPNPAHHGGGDFLLDGGRLRTAAPDRDVPGRSTVPARFTYAGIGLYSPAMFADVDPSRKSPLRPWLEREIGAGRAFGEYHPGSWFDVGTVERLAALDRFLSDREPGRR